MFTGPVGPVKFFFYWPEAVLGNFYWPGAIGLPLASSPVIMFQLFFDFCICLQDFINIVNFQLHVLKIKGRH